MQCGVVAAMGTRLWAALRQERLDEAAGKQTLREYLAGHRKASDTAPGAMS